jgi:cytochrome c oxidase subunit 3
VLWLNTLLLVLASGTLELARRTANGASIDQLRSVFVGACALTLLFLAGQVWAWQIVAADSELPRLIPAYSFFVLLTAVHGLHLLGGLLVLTRATARIWGGIDPVDAAARARIKQTIQLCATYWHYLLLVWLGLFIMLLST